MKSFKELGIKVELPESFVGDKIKMNKVLNREIMIHDYKIEDTKIEEFDGKCLHLQISIDGTKRVIFTGAKALIQMIEMVPESEFPFTTTIIEEEDNRFLFS